MLIHKTEQGYKVERQSWQEWFYFEASESALRHLRPGEFEAMFPLLFLYRNTSSHQRAVQMYALWFPLGALMWLRDMWWALGTWCVQKDLFRHLPPPGERPHWFWVIYMFPKGWLRGKEVDRVVE